MFSDWSWVDWAKAILSVLMFIGIPVLLSIAAKFD